MPEALHFNGRVGSRDEGLEGVFYGPISSEESRHKMTRVEQLDAIIEQFNLNNHPFYQAWRMGTLPTAKLETYAAEYGNFIGTIAKGWDTIGEHGYAEEEREHEVLWSNFKSGLGVSGTGSLATTNTLVTAANAFFGEKATAVGALYSFEAQQPNTSRSKLDGLNEHYSLSAEAKEYFVVHADDIHEVEDLKGYVARQSEEEFAQTKAACAVVCAAMWTALDGVYYARETVSA